MYVVKYDLQSMVKLIKCIQQHPLLYDTNHQEYSIRLEQDRAWKIIAKEVEESESLCRDRWRSIRACFGRHLRNKNVNRKPYYLAEYLDFLIPFTSAAKEDKHNTLEDCFSRTLTSKKNENGSIGGSTYGSLGDDSATGPQLYDNGDGDYYDYEDIFDEWIVDISSDKTTIEVPAKRRRMSTSPMIDDNSIGSDLKPTLTIKEEGNVKESSSDIAHTTPPRKIINSTDADIVFFKSLLPEVARMSPTQKLQFRQTVLGILNDILYSRQDPNKQGDTEGFTMEQEFHKSFEPSITLTEVPDSEANQQTDVACSL